VPNLAWISDPTCIGVARIFAARVHSNVASKMLTIF